MTSLYRKFVSWLARDIIAEERKSAFENGALLEKGRVLLEAQQDASDESYQAGISYAMGQRQLQDGRDRMLKEFLSLFPLLTTVQNDFGNPEIIIAPNRDLLRPEVWAEAQAQKDRAFRDGWNIALTTGTKPMEF